MNSQKPDGGVLEGDLGRTLFLLGAGASVDGGLPTSVQLTDLLVTDLRTRPIAMPDEPRAKMLKALDFILATLSKAGKPVDFELLGATADAMYERDKNVLAPFVSQWSPGFEDLTWADFFSLRYQLGPAIRRQLLRDDEQLKQFDYLSPLIDLGKNPGGVSIVSLNYDLTIEGQARLRSVQCETGYEDMNAGQLTTWPGEGIRLLKLHGSIDWSKPGVWSTTGEIARFEFEPSPDPFNDDDTPVIIFGRGNKLRPDPLFFNLYANFLNFLARSKALVLIGYSFRDEHVNSAILDWLVGDPETKVYVINPTLPDLTQSALQWADQSSDGHFGMVGALGPLFISGTPYLLDPTRAMGFSVTAGDGLSKLI